MKPFSLMLPAFWSIFHLLLLFTFGPNNTASALGSDTDHFALLQLKKSISNDPYGILVPWNTSTHFCNWHGVTCNPIYQRVTELNLQGYELHGLIAPQLGNLSFLSNLNLGNNSFYGKIPQELGRLLKLQQLTLANNSLVGEIPSNLTSCSELRGLYLSENNLIGKIPIDIGNLRNLQRFTAGANNLTGQIPPSIWNISSLNALAAGFNNLEGNIPEEIGRLKNFSVLGVPSNKLSGTFPSSLYNMSSLTVISVGNNQFNGSLPPNVFLHLPNLQKFDIGGNQISGPIPTSIINASALQEVDISHNHFVGQVPVLGMLKDLLFLGLSSNNLGSNSSQDLEFLKSLTNCTELGVISISKNNLGGRLPNSLGNLSTQLSQLYLADNHIFGKIPEELGNLISLIILNMRNNHFEGTIPVAFGKFQKMQALDLSANKLSGNIPAVIGNLSQMFALALSQTMLEGNIPPNIGNCQNLQYLDLSRNNLRGTIPSEVISISSLTNLLDLSQNSLSGNLPDEVGMLKNIGMLDVSENYLSGDIPGTIGECISLEYLSLQGNSFNGIIPSSLASLKGLRHLDLSRNNLSGSIPKGLQNISVLQYLNVSFNMLEGEVPISGVFHNESAISLIGNSKLCGGISVLQLPACPIKFVKQRKHHNFKLEAVIVGVIVFLLLLSSIIVIFKVRKRRMKPSSNLLTINQLPQVAYKSLHQATNGFSESNFVASGSFGSVYRVSLMSEDRVVAIKVLNLQKKGANKSFVVECNALRNIRHRNLVKILTCCSSTDYQGNEFKALVFEYMKNGSLKQWLHPQIVHAEQPRKFDLHQRLNIIIDVANALHYLHYECEQPIIHCDLKPCNVLLDNHMVAHVSDFGLARLLSTINSTSDMQTSTIGIKGTVGYIPPEYGMGSEVSTQGDMYSFGILMLEMLTGRSPTDDMFKDGQNLHNFVKIAFPENFLQILEPPLAQRYTEAATEEVNDENLGLSPNVMECIVSLLRIGLACSMESPKERMNMKDVTKDLNLIIKAFLVGGINGD